MYIIRYAHVVYSEYIEQIFRPSVYINIHIYVVVYIYIYVHMRGYAPMYICT